MICGQDWRPASQRRGSGTALLPAEALGALMLTKLTNPVTQKGFGAVGVDDLINTDILENRMFWAGTHPGVPRLMLDYLADPIRENFLQVVR